jgi:hypothetical protein
MLRHISTPGCAFTARFGKSTLCKIFDLHPGGFEDVRRIRRRGNFVRFVICGPAICVHLCSSVAKMADVFSKAKRSA